MKLITLDWEGTLADFQWNLADAVAETTEALEQKNIPGKTFANMDYAAIYNLVQEKGSEWGYGDGSLLSLVDRIYDRYDLDAASRWILCERLGETLKKLKDFKLALVSNIGRKGIAKALTRFGLQDSFGLVLTRNDVRLLKPAPEGIMQAMAWAGAKKEEAIHIGDSLSDVFAARNAGVRIGVVLGGQNKTETLLQENPDVVLEKLYMLAEAIQQL
jgi:phosphoglycolate phosphatase